MGSLVNAHKLRQGFVKGSPEVKLFLINNQWRNCAAIWCRWNECCIYSNRIFEATKCNIFKIYSITVNMIIIKAFIKLYQDGRKTPFFNGYRPVFNFVKVMKTSGQITLIDREAFYPGDEGLVEIAFPCKDYLGDNFSEGTKFTFGEGREPLGEGNVKEIMN